VIAALYDEALDKGREALQVASGRFHELVSLVPAVKAVRVGVDLQPRFAEFLPEQAILLKVARQISVVSFLNRAVETGNIYEQGILQRISDETSDDVTFLSLGVRSGLKNIHRRFLNAFWKEDFVDDGSGAKFTYVPQVSRKEIRQYIASHFKELGIEGSESASRTVYGVFSGYVHGGAGYIFELFDKRESKFRLQGGFDREQQLSYLVSAVNYPYRAIMSVVHADQAITRGRNNEALFEYYRQYGPWLDNYLDRAERVAEAVKFPVKIPRS
jgi:hypothetical protein